MGKNGNFYDCKRQKNPQNNQCKKGSPRKVTKSRIKFTLKIQYTIRAQLT